MRPRRIGCSVTVPNPHLWNGRQDPYLYQAVVELRSADGVVDSVEQPLGLRFYSVDPDKGFFLNGKPYHLHGVNRHQDRFNKGWAISEADMDEDIQLIKEIGAHGRPLRALPAQRLFLQPVRQGGHSRLGRTAAGERNQSIAAIRRNLAQPVARFDPAEHQSSLDFRLEPVQRTLARQT